MNPLSPLKTTTTNNPTVPQAYRFWALWANQLSGGCFQVKDVKAASMNGLSVDDAVPYLCEVYARATFETILGLHFDGQDSRVDLLVLSHIVELFDTATEQKVLAACAPCRVQRDGGEHV